MDNQNTDSPKTVTVEYVVRDAVVSKTLTGDKAGYDFIRQGDNSFFKAWAGNATHIIPLNSLVSFNMEG